MTFTGVKKQVSITSHCRRRNNESHHLPSDWLSTFLLCSLSPQEVCSYELNNNLRHTEKYFRRTRLLDPILVTVCEKTMQHWSKSPRLWLRTGCLMTPSLGRIKPDSSASWCFGKLNKPPLGWLTLVAVHFTQTVFLYPEKSLWIR